MSLPIGYSTSNSYFHDAFEFLSEFQWIFNTSNTQYITKCVLDKIPKSWLPSLLNLTNDELNELPFGGVNEKWDLNFVTFLQRLNRLKPTYVNKRPNSGDYPKIKGVSPKKLHEIENLSAVINETCSEQLIDVFVDFGCGLGYLTQMLSERYGYCILGIEGNQQNVDTAIKRQEKYFPNSKENVKFVKHFIEIDSANFIKDKIVELFSKSVKRIAFIGMHACADLSITSLQLFTSMDAVKSILIMPCCYHKMKIIDPDSETMEFVNVPISEEVKRFKTDIINRPFLRLASQQTASKWRCQSEEELHGESMFIRGVADAILGKDEVLSKVKGDSNGFDFTRITNRYELVNGNWSDTHRKRYDKVIKDNPNGEKLSEILKALQACLQLLCENIVLLDRVCFMREQNESEDIKFTVEKIVDDDISPRCFAFIGGKKS